MTGFISTVDVLLAFLLVRQCDAKSKLRGLCRCYYLCGVVVDGRILPMLREGCVRAESWSLLDKSRSARNLMSLCMLPDDLVSSKKTDSFTSSFSSRGPVTIKLHRSLHASLPFVDILIVRLFLLVSLYYVRSESRSSVGINSFVPLCF